MYDPTDPFNNFPLPPCNSGDANPEETLRGCLITGAIILGFMALVLSLTSFQNSFSHETEHFPHRCTPGGNHHWLSLCQPHSFTSKVR